MMFCADKMYHGRICRDDGRRSAGGGGMTADRDTKKPRRGGRRGKKYAEDPSGPPHIQKKKTAG